MSEIRCAHLCALGDHGPAIAQPAIVAQYEYPNFDPPSEEALIAAVQQVCRAGWYRARATRLGVSGQLDDLEQTTFLHTWRARDTFDPAYPVVPRVARIAGNVLIDAVRYRGRRRMASLDDEQGERRYDPADASAGPSEEAQARETAERLKSLIESAPEQVRRTLALLERDATFEQAAAALGKTKAAVVSAYHRWKVATLARLS